MVKTIFLCLFCINVFVFNISTLFLVQKAVFSYTKAKLPYLTPNICDFLAYALFSQILSFILMTWRQSFSLILILLNPERDNMTNLEINFKAFIPYKNHWFYIVKNEWLLFFIWKLYFSSFNGEDWSLSPQWLLFSLNNPLYLGKAQICPKKDLPVFLSYLSSKMCYGHAAKGDTSVLYQLFFATVVCFFLESRFLMLKFL